ncbi:MAG: YceI family protein [Fimbriimonas sp.]
MKKKTVLAATALTLGLASYVTFHPGVAFATPAYAAGQSTSLPAQGSFTVDPMHTSIGFEIGHMGISKIQGRFNKHAGKLVVDAKNPAASSVEFTIQTESIDTAVAPRDNHLRSPDFFEVAKYPELTFKSTRIRKAGKGYVAEGDLTLKGVTKKISIPFQAYGPIADGQNGGQRIGIVAEPIKLNRRDYGINYGNNLPNGKPAIDNEVTVKLALEATLDKAAK